jgi:hypothetical protein
MLNLLPLTGFLRAAVCLHNMQFSKGEVSPRRKTFCNKGTRRKRIIDNVKNISVQRLIKDGVRNIQNPQN